MKTPQEIDVWYVLPAIRGELAKALSKEGMKQKDIAKQLGVTEAAVSQYISKKRAQEIKLPASIKSDIKTAASNIHKMQNCHRFELYTLSDKIRKSGFLCTIHRKYDKDVPICCTVCLDGVHKSGCRGKASIK